MMAPTEQARPDLLQVAKQVGQELFRDAKAFRPLGFGVLRKKQDVHASRVELEMTRDRERGDAASAFRPSADQGDDEAVAVVQFSPFAGRRQPARFIHHFHAEIERVPEVGPADRTCLAARPELKGVF